MTRNQYLEARRMYRDNGRSALKWMAPETAQTMRALIDSRDDVYAELVFFYRSHAGFDAPDTSAKLRFRYHPLTIASRD
tara:strand:+ start:138 stop:374 length:237 start_codon:yes stop_codon:yes gene_type:complete